MVQLTLTLNVLAFALAQLVLGPLSDRLGRRPVMLAGIGVFTLVSAACALAPTIEALIGLRVLQGFAASVEAVIGLAILRDLYEGPTRVRALAVWGMAIALTPAAAPILGGHIHIALGWRANFWLIAAVGVACVGLIWRRLPESARIRRDPRRAWELVRAYRALVTNPRFMRPALVLGAALGAIFAFITAGPFILIERHGVAIERYGYYQAAIVAAFFVGSVLSTRWAGRMDLDRLLGLGSAFALAGSLALPLLLWSGLLGPLTLTGAMSLLTFGLGPIFAGGPSHALDAAGVDIGVGSALVGSLQMGMAGAASAMVTVLHDGTARPLVLSVITMLGIALLAWRLDRATA
jgi:DHA1 family bicyclomycin/chloramphenicol resistance-like MFS transporter